jgi:hypothetical protein
MVGSTRVATLTTAPYRWTWRTSLWTNGSTPLYAKVVKSTSPVVYTEVYHQVTVSNPFGAVILRPTAGSTLSGTVTIEVVTNEPTSHVELLINSVKQTTDRSAPYVWTWNSTTTRNGTRPIYVKAVKPDGRHDETLIYVTVRNP